MHKMATQKELMVSRSISIADSNNMREWDDIASSRVDHIVVVVVVGFFFIGVIICDTPPFPCPPSSRFWVRSYMTADVDFLFHSSVISKQDAPHARFDLLGVTYFMFRLIVILEFGLEWQGNGRKRKLRVDEKETPQTVYLWKKERKRWSPPCSKRQDRGFFFFSSIEKHNFHFGITLQIFVCFCVTVIANWNWVSLLSISSIGEALNVNKCAYQIPSYLTFHSHLIWDELLSSFSVWFYASLWFWWFLI